MDRESEEADYERLLDDRSSRSHSTRGFVLSVRLHNCVKQLGKISGPENREQFTTLNIHKIRTKIFIFYLIF